MMTIKPLIKRRPVPEHFEYPSDSIPDWMAKVLAARGVTSSDQLVLELKKLVPPVLRGLEHAVAILISAIHGGQRILIVGDYDADGATSTALAVRALRAMGADQVSFRVPDRLVFGYGLTERLAQDILASQAPKPDVVVTVDNGISSVAGVACLKEAGVSVVITDHHLAGDALPDADAIVNPNQPGCEFPSKHLAGVGVMFYCLIALRAKLRELQWFAERGIDEPNLSQWLDLVALGTVADVVALDRVNRILVAQGLHRIRRGQCCAGISALFQVAARPVERATAQDLGFYVGPRLNAAGRLDDMSEGIRCLITDDPAEASQLADHLQGMNQQRRNLQRSMQNQAERVVAQLDLDALAAPHNTLVLHHLDWHEGVVGLVASQIKTRYHRPTIAFAPAANGEWKGSARSVEGLNIRDAIALVDAKTPGLIEKFGGHAMAAGLSVREGQLGPFSEAFEVAVTELMFGRSLDPVLWTDGVLRSVDVNLESAKLIQKLGPWGQQFEQPLFEGCFEILDQRIVGERHLKLTLGLSGSNRVVDAIKFQHGPDVLDDKTAWNIVYRLDVNHFRGVDRLQLLVEYVEPSRVVAGVGMA